MKDKIISKTVYEQFYHKYNIFDNILFNIFNEYLKNENLNFDEKNLYLINKFKSNIINKFISFSDIDNILEPAISDYEYDPHNFNSYGIRIKNIDKKLNLYIGLNLYNSFRFSIKSNNIVSKYTDIIDNNIKYFFIEIIIWVKNTNNNDIDYYKKIFNINKENIYLISNKTIFQEFKYMINISNNNIQLEETNTNIKNNNLINTTIKKHLIKITSEIIYKFNPKDNLFWSDIKKYLDFEISLNKNNFNNSYKKIVNILNNIFITDIINNINS